MTILFERGRACAEQVVAHLQACDKSFVPVLSGRVNIAEYGKKIAEHALCFEAWSDGELVGLVATYCNATDRQLAYITSVSILPSWQGRGIATRLLETCVNYVHELGFAYVELEVALVNEPAIALYKKHEFVLGKELGGMAKMSLDLRREDR